MLKTNLSILEEFDSFYFLGIGGIGMSALARYFLSKKKNVGGYDLTPSTLTKELEKQGIPICFEDTLEAIPKWVKKEKTLIIYTPALAKEHKQYAFFKEHLFSIEKRASIIGHITQGKYTIAIAGTHGKTTISAILSHILYSAGKKITAFIGGIMQNYQSNFISNGEEIFVIEADEFDRSFLKLSPTIISLSSIDPDHLDIYENEENFKAAFSTFIEKLPRDKGMLFIQKNIPLTPPPMVSSFSYGLKEDQEKIDCYSTLPYSKEGEKGWFFNFYAKKDCYKDLPLPLIGKHNLENITTAIAIARALDIKPSDIHKALLSFKGIKRRASTYFIKDKIYIDDYAHHPSEINAIIEGVKSFFPHKKIVGIFQPHLFSRTRDFLEGFAQSLNKLDELILLDIYPAREKPIQGINATLLFDKIKLKDKKKATLSELPQIIRAPFDILLTLGAGSIGELVNPIIEHLKRMHK